MQTPTYLLTKSDLKLGQLISFIWYSTRTFQWEMQRCEVDCQYPNEPTRGELCLYEGIESNYRFFERSLHLIFKDDLDGEICIKVYKANVP